MNFRIFLPMLSLLFVFENSHALDAQSTIRKMQGCYEVSFEFVETFVRLPQSSGKSAPYFETVLEWVQVDGEKDGEIHLQHILNVGEGQFIKHWREEWTKNKPSEWVFKGREDFADAKSSLVWEKAAPQMIEGSWLQRVTQVDDSPRYECNARWVDTGRKQFWECESPAPQPRRESKRKDYDVVIRNNKHYLTSQGWMHEQDNKKARSSDHAVVAEEKGWNTYKKVDDAQCAAAQKWWGERREVWNFIQGYWRDLYSTEKKLVIKSAVAGEPLWMKLTEWAEAHTQSPLDQNLKSSLDAVVQPYLK